MSYKKDVIDPEVYGSIDLSVLPEEVVLKILEDSGSEINAAGLQKIRQWAEAHEELRLKNDPDIVGGLWDK